MTLHKSPIYQRLEVAPGIFETVATDALVSEEPTPRTGRAEQADRNLSPKHLGPGPHPSGSPQSVHGRQLSGAPDTEAFRRWFGDSKVVDEFDEPQETHGVLDSAPETPEVVFHGTLQNFVAFAPDRRRDFAQAGRGYYFAEDRRIAEAYADPHARGVDKEGVVIDAYLRIENPLDLDRSISIEELRQIRAHYEGEPPHEELRGFWASTQRGIFRDIDFLISEVEEAERPVSWGWMQRNMLQWDLFFNQVIKSLGYDGITHRSTDRFGGVARTSTQGSEFGRIWIAFDPTQIKAVDNIGSFDPSDPDIYKHLGGATGTAPHPSGSPQSVHAGGSAAGIDLHPTVREIIRIKQDQANRHDLPSIIDLAQEWAWFIGREIGEPGTIDPDPQEVKRMLDSALEKSELIIAFKPGLADVIAADDEPRIKNLWEVQGTESNLIFHDAAGIGWREKYELANFGWHLHEVPHAQRPKYGSVAWEPKERPIGQVGFYGSAAFVLNKEAVAGRVTYAPSNTAESNPEWIATIENPYLAMALSYQGLTAAGFPDDFLRYLSREGEIAMGNLRNPANEYDEIQVWGELPINPETIEKIRVIDQYEVEMAWHREKAKFWDAERKERRVPDDYQDPLTREEYHAGLLELSEKTGVPLEFIDWSSL